MFDCSTPVLSSTVGSIGPLKPRRDEVNYSSCKKRSQTILLGLFKKINMHGYVKDSYIIISIYLHFRSHLIQLTDNHSMMT